MSAPPPDARESALDEALDWLDDAVKMLGGIVPNVAAARAERDDLRAELSALRASQGAVAMEFVEAADRVRAFGVDMLLAAQESPNKERLNGLALKHVGVLAAYDALRPAATGEGDIDATLDEIEGVLNEFFGANRDEERDTRPLREQLRAAIARAEGRKGT